MSAVRCTFINGKIVPDMLPDWPEGTRLIADRTPVPPVPMMTDDEQGDDPESIARWLAAFDAIPLATASPFDDPAVVAWRDAMRRHNVEAVRKQMQEVLE